MRISYFVKSIAVIGAVSFVGVGAATAAQVTHFSANGASASVNTFDGTASLDLSVTRNDQGQNTTSNLFFNKQTCDANGCTGVFGFGTIPNADLTIATGTARLNTNLATVPGFSAFSFVQDFVNGTFTQTPITGGIITIDWHILPRNSTSQSGHSSTTSGGFSVHMHGQSTSNRATATGSFFASPVAPGGSNFVGNTKTSTITIIRD